MNKILSELNDLTTLGNTTNNSSNNLNCEESGEGDGNSEEFASAPAATLRRVIYKLFPLPYKPLKLKIKERMRREAKQLQYINAATAAAVISENGRRQRTCAVAYRMSKSSTANPYSSITTTNIVNTTTGSGSGSQNKGGKLKRKLRTEESSSSSSSEDDAMFVETDDEVVVGGGGKGQQQDEGEVKQEAKKARRTVVRDSEEEEEQGGEGSSKMNTTPSTTIVEINKTTAIAATAPCIDLTAIAATSTENKQAPFGKSDGVNGWSIYRREGWVLTNNTDTAILQEDINTAIRHMKEENEEITVTEELASDMYTQALQGAQYVHTTVYKAFRKCDMIGWVVGYLPAVVNEGEELWHVVFVDGDEEDMDPEEVSACAVAVTVEAAVLLW